MRKLSPVVQKSTVDIYRNESDSHAVTRDLDRVKLFKRTLNERYTQERVNPRAFPGVPQLGIFFSCRSRVAMRISW